MNLRRSTDIDWTGSITRLASGKGDSVSQEGTLLCSFQISFSFYWSPSFLEVGMSLKGSHVGSRLGLSRVVIPASSFWILLGPDRTGRLLGSRLYLFIPVSSPSSPELLDLFGGCSSRYLGIDLMNSVVLKRWMDSLDDEDGIFFIRHAEISRKPLVVLGGLTYSPMASRDVSFVDRGALLTSSFCSLV